MLQQTGDQFFGTDILGIFGLVPFAFLREYRFWQILTYPFFHRDVMQLFFNLMMLAFIGSDIEAAWGSRRFLKYFFFCSVSAGLTYVLIQTAVGLQSGHFRAHAPMNGATGAIYGLLMAYGLIFGERVLLFMMLFPMKAKHFIWVLALLELFTTLYSGGGGLASIGHLAGMIAGFGYLWWGATLTVLRNRSKQSKKKRRNQHLKLIVNNAKDFEREDDDSENNPKTWH
jgi:membrane associated rhomboid family serine protease